MRRVHVSQSRKHVDTRKHVQCARWVTKSSTDGCKSYWISHAGHTVAVTVVSAMSAGTEFEGDSNKPCRIVGLHILLNGFLYGNLDVD